MLRAWRNAGTRLDVANNVEAEMLGEIGPGTVIGNDFAAGIGLHLRLPLLVGLFEALLEGIVALRKIGGLVRAHLAELGLDALRDAQASVRVEPVVRVPQRMNVAFGAGDLAGGEFQDSGKSRGVKITWSADLNPRIAGLRN